MTTEQSHDNALQTPGLILKTAREVRGLSQQDVAHRLNLRISLIRDIEQDRFDQKTASTFTRGYLKTYARFVGADEQAVLAAYDRLGLKDQKYSEMYSFSGRTQREANEHRVRIISWVLCIGLVGAGGAWWWLQPAEEPVPTSINEAGQLVVKGASEVAKAISAADATKAIETTAHASAAVTTNTETAVSSASTTEPDTAESPDAEDQTPTVLSDTAAQTSEPAPNDVVPAADTNGNSENTSSNVETKATPTAVDSSVALQLQFTGGCWLRVADANGKSLFEGTKKSGDKISLTGKEPFSLTIGAPRAVSVYFHGKPVDMTSYIRQGVVARYKLPLKN